MRGTPSTHYMLLPIYDRAGNVRAFASVDEGDYQCIGRFENEVEAAEAAAAFRAEHMPFSIEGR